MITLKHLTVAAAVTLVTATGAFAQKTTEMAAGDGGTAHRKTEWSVSGATVSITYGRPALKGRAESLLMPIGKVWRTGADAPSILTTDKTLKFGAVTLAPGSYTINTEPGATSWQLIFGKLGSAGQWGIPYLPDLELGRAPMTLGKTAAPVELLTLSIDPLKDGGTLHIDWGTKRVSAPFTVAN